jgi:2,3-bisphosphoglycerate-independent phosphoglycerate mutase
MDKLKRSDRFPEPGGPVVEIIMDGVGVAPGGPGNAVVEARTPTLDGLVASCLNTLVRAHGIAAGLPSDDDMGNSEVGHNALGGGRIFDQGAKLVNKAVATGALFEGEVWKAIVERSKSRKSALHLIGLLSDGNVHSHIDQLLALIDGAARDGIARLRVHILTDGRDVGERTALTYIDRVEESLRTHRGNGLDYLIASGGGRMIVTMDRYGADWSIVERGWKAHVLGDARPFPSASEAVQTLYDEDKDVNDQFLPAFVVVDDDDRPVGKMADGDSVVFFNFRGDRAIEISRAFEDEEFDKFDRGAPLDLFYAGMMQYDGDLMLPKKYLVSPPAISESLGEHLALTGVTQFATAETQKYGHVTYFWNGNRSGKFSDKLETYLEVPSDQVPFERRPWMKAGEVTDQVVKAIASGEFQFIRVNYANGDMVGHTGHYGATMIAVEAGPGAGAARGAGRERGADRHRRPRQQRRHVHDEEGRDPARRPGQARPQDLALAQPRGLRRVRPPGAVRHGPGHREARPRQQRLDRDQPPGLRGPEELPAVADPAEVDRRPYS